jgi:hypothetical protein
VVSSNPVTSGSFSLPTLIFADAGFFVADAFFTVAFFSGLPAEGEMFCAIAEGIPPANPAIKRMNADSVFIDIFPQVLAV